MKILVFGAGAIGSALGGFLSRFHEVTLLGRSWHLDPIRQRGLRVHGIWGTHTFRNFRLENDAAHLFREKPDFDLVLVTVKSYDTERAARSLRHRIGEHALVLSLQNGIGNVEILHRFLPPRQVLAGRVIFGVEIKPGEIKITVSADATRIGESTSKRLTPRVILLARHFREVGLPTEAVRDVSSYLWMKLAYNAALNPLASLLDVAYGRLAEHASTRFLMDQIIREAYRVAKAHQVNLKPHSADGFIRLFYRRLVPRTYDHHPSMLQDLKRGRVTEIDALSGAVARLGEAFGIPTPYNQLMTEVMRSLESR